MEKKGKKISQDTKLLGTGVGLLIIVLVIISITFTFLINNVLPAIAPYDETVNEEIYFDLEGFEELGL